MLDETDFTGGVAVITGAASGLGAALVTRAAELHMRVVLADLDLDAASELSNRLNSRGATTVAMRIDVRRPDDLDGLADFAFERWGHVDLLVNNAGVEAHGRVWEMPSSLWDSVVGVNLNGVFHGMRSFIPRMLASGRRSHIVNVASVASLGIRPHTGPYRVTKHACLALTEVAAQELALVTSEVIISAAIPGSVKTAIFTNSVSADDDGPGASGKRDMIEANAKNGMAPDDAAKIILEQAARGILHIHTHPDLSRELLDERSAELRALWAESGNE